MFVESCVIVCALEGVVNVIGGVHMLCELVILFVQVCERVVEMYEYAVTKCELGEKVCEDVVNVSECLVYEFAQVDLS